MRRVAERMVAIVSGPARGRVKRVSQRRPQGCDDEGQWLSPSLLGVGRRTGTGAWEPAAVPDGDDGTCRTAGLFNSRAVLC
jgi:hypothetical protein